MVKTKFPMLEQRRIEANILKAIYAEMKRRLGEASAQDILGWLFYTSGAAGEGFGVDLGGRRLI